MLKRLHWTITTPTPAIPYITPYPLPLAIIHFPYFALLPIFCLVTAACTTHHVIHQSEARNLALHQSESRIQIERSPVRIREMKRYSSGKWSRNFVKTPRSVRSWFKLKLIPKNGHHAHRAKNKQNYLSTVRRTSDKNTCQNYMKTCFKQSFWHSNYILWSYENKRAIPRKHNLKYPAVSLNMIEVSIIPSPYQIRPVNPSTLHPPLSLQSKSV